MGCYELGVGTGGSDGDGVSAARCERDAGPRYGIAAAVFDGEGAGATGGQRAGGRMGAACIREGASRRRAIINRHVADAGVGERGRLTWVVKDDAEAVAIVASGATVV